METPDVHQAPEKVLVDSLLANFHPVKRLWPVNARLALWLVLEAGIAGVVFVFAPRPDLPMKMQSIQYMAELGAFACASLWAARLALRSAIPGEDVTTRELGLMVMVVVVAIAVVCQEPVDAAIPLQRFLQAGIRCVGCTYLLAALPAVALLWAVRRGVPLAGATSGGLSGAAALWFAFTVTRLGCPIDERLHILLWHVVPLLVGTALSAFLGIALWSRRSRQRGGLEKHHR